MSMHRTLYRKDYRQEMKVRWLLVHRQNNQGAICNKLHQGMFIFIIRFSHVTNFFLCYVKVNCDVGCWLLLNSQSRIKWSSKYRYMGKNGVWLIGVYKYDSVLLFMFYKFICLIFFKFQRELISRASYIILLSQFPVPNGYFLCFFRKSRCISTVVMNYIIVIIIINNR